jgi:RND family efflux transporter MFP subunit
MNVNKTSLDALRIDRDVPQGSGRRWIIVSVAVLVIAIAGILAGALLRPDVLSVQTARAAEITGGSGKLTVLNASGYVTARRQATVSSKVTGKVVEVLIEEGLEVEEGQLLARLDDSITSANLRLAEAQAASAEKQLEETRVRIREARLDYDRMSRLARDEVASVQDLDRAKAQLESFEARLAVLEKELEVTRRNVALHRQELSDTEIRAPFTGIVVSKNAQPGEMISPISAGGGFTRTGICTIVDMSSLEIEVDVNEAYITRVRAEQAVEAVLDAYPDWRIPSHVITIIPSADRQKATVRVRIGFDERDDRVLPDMGVKVSFISDEEVAERSPILTIPRSALRRDGEQDIVYVVKGDVVERRAVRVGVAEGDKVQLASGVAAGEEVVVEGPEELTDGARIRVEEKENR